MAFVCSLKPDMDLNFRHFSFPSEFAADAKIGFDDETGSTFSLQTSFQPISGGGPKDFDQIFVIVEAEINEINPHEPLTYDYYSGLQTLHKIPDRSDRALILKTLQFLTKILISLTEPNMLTVTTYDANLPAKAREKYELLAQTYRELGYEAGRGNSYHGIHIWMAVRSSR